MESMTFCESSLDASSPLCYIYNTGRVFVQVETQLSYDIFVIILSICFGLENGPSSGHNTRI